MRDANELVEYDVSSIVTPLHLAFQLQKQDVVTVICKRCPEFAIACLVAQNPEDNADCMLHALASAGDDASIVACFCALQDIPVPVDYEHIRKLTDPALLAVLSTPDSEGSSCLHWAVEVCQSSFYCSLRVDYIVTGGAHSSGRGSSQIEPSSAFCH